MVWACTASDVVLVGEGRNGVIFLVSLCRVCFCFQPSVTFVFLRVLSLFCFGSVVFSK